MTATATATRTRKQPAAKKAEKPVEQKVESTVEQKPEVEQKPKADITVDAVAVTYYKASVTFPDGRTVECEHRYLHEQEKYAAACGRKIATNGKFVK